jgi:HD-GYP domain-containing protein (c-di-GMP phosphodiesterase class II)
MPDVLDNGIQQITGKSSAPPPAPPTAQPITVAPAPQEQPTGDILDRNIQQVAAGQTQQGGGGGGEKPPARTGMGINGADLFSREEWESQPFTRALGGVASALKTPITKAVLGSSALEFVNRTFPKERTNLQTGSREPIGGLGGMSGDTLRLAASLVDFAQTGEGLANTVLTIASGGASTPFQAGTYGAVMGSQIPDLFRKWQASRNPADNKDMGNPEALQDLLMTTALVTSMASHFVEHGGPKSVLETLETGKGFKEMAKQGNANWKTYMVARNQEKAAEAFSKALGKTELARRSKRLGNSVMTPDYIRESFTDAAPYLSEEIKKYPPDYLSKGNFTSTDFNDILDRSRMKVEESLENIKQHNKDIGADPFTASPEAAPLLKAKESLEVLNDMVSNPTNVKAIENGIDTTWKTKTAAVGKAGFPIVVGGVLPLHGFGILGGVLYDMMRGEPSEFMKAWTPSPVQRLQQATQRASKVTPAEYPPMHELEPEGTPGGKPALPTAPQGILPVPPETPGPKAPTARQIANRVGAAVEPQVTANNPPLQKNVPIGQQLLKKGGVGAGMEGKEPTPITGEPPKPAAEGKPTLPPGAVTVENSASHWYKVEPENGTVTAHPKTRNESGILYRWSGMDPDRVKTFQDTIDAKNKGEDVSVGTAFNELKNKGGWNLLEQSNDGGKTWFDKTFREVKKEEAKGNVQTLRPEDQPPSDKFDSKKFNDDGFVMMPDSVMKAFDAVKEFFTSKGEKAKAAEDLQARSKAMGDISRHDMTTYQHSMHTGELGAKLGEWMGLDEGAAHQLGEDLKLHDIGKLKVSAATLQATGRLSPNQINEIFKHPEEGVKLLKEYGITTKQLNDIVGGHHEKYSGGGYPTNKPSKGMPLAVRIATLVDSFDAMTSNRGYNTPRSVEDALKELSDNKGVQFDPDIVRVFTAGMRGKSLVTKETGRIAPQLLDKPTEGGMTISPFKDVLRNRWQEKEATRAAERAKVAEVRAKSRSELLAGKPKPKSKPKTDQELADDFLKKLPPQ